VSVTILGRAGIQMAQLHPFDGFGHVLPACSRSPRAGELQLYRHRIVTLAPRWRVAIKRLDELTPIQHKIEGRTMSSLDQFRTKAEELMTKAQQETSFITRALFEGLAASYLRLAEHEARRQIQNREGAWNALARENGWRCECGEPIPYCDRDRYFESRLCADCYRSLGEHMSRPREPSNTPGREAPAPEGRPH
jgi:hypothetical protein